MLKISKAVLVAVENTVEVNVGVVRSTTTTKSTFQETTSPSSPIHSEGTPDTNHSGGYEIQ